MSSWNIKLNNLRVFYYITFLLLFFQTFVIYFAKGTYANIPIYAFCIYAIGILLLLNLKKSMLYVSKLLKLPTVRTQVLFVVISLLVSLLHIFMGHYTSVFFYYLFCFIKFYTYFIGIYFFILIAPLFKVKTRSLIRLFYYGILIIYIVAVIQYLSYILNITFIQNIINFITNERQTLYQFFGSYETYQKNLRVFSLFREPSVASEFIFITMPFIINLSKLHVKLFKHKILDKTIKILMPVLMFAVLFLAKSPIFIILCLIEFFILIAKKYFNFIKQHLVSLLVIFLALISIMIYFFLTPENIEALVPEFVLKRIKVTIDCFGNYDLLAWKEASLATRIYSYMNQFLIFMHFPLIGAGLYNSEAYVATHIINNPLPMTEENMYQTFINAGFTGINRCLAYELLSDLGIIGAICYINFVARHIITAKRLLKIIDPKEYYFLYSVWQSLILISIISFYNLSFKNLPLIWIIFAFVSLYLYGTKYRIR